jgi:hypothetical protein
LVEKVLLERPLEADLLWLAGVYSLEQDRPAAALAYAERLQAVSPGSPRATTLLRQARGRVAVD